MLKVLSRYHTERVFEIISDNEIKFIAYECLYCTINGSKEEPDSVDPDGGPYISVGKTIEILDQFYKIKRIKQYEFNQEKELFIAVLEVIKLT